MGIGKLIIPLGIITYCLVILTIISGLRGWKIKGHKLLASFAIGFATIHLLIVIFLR